MAEKHPPRLPRQLGDRFRIRDGHSLPQERQKFLAGDVPRAHGQHMGRGLLTIQQEEIPFAQERHQTRKGRPRSFGAAMEHGFPEKATASQSRSRNSSAQMGASFASV